MFTPEDYDRLYPLACQWAEAQQKLVLTHGTPLSHRHLHAAETAGVRHPEHVRILAVPQIPLPDDHTLRAAALRTNIISNACRGIAIGYAVILRADSWADQELLTHQLVHVAQYERVGGIAPFLQLYFQERLDSSTFGVGPLEREARSVAQQLAAVSTA
jgi:hypothetical protein